MIRSNPRIALVLAFILFFFSPLLVKAQTTAKPYKIHTSGKEVTIKSSKPIKEVMVWTNTGYRIVENRAVHSNNFSFLVNVQAKIIFVMIHYGGNKPFTEKLGL